MTLVGPTLKTATSAIAVGGTIVVITIAPELPAVLLVGLGSVVSEAAVAILVRLPLAGAFTVRLTLVDVPLAIEPSNQVTILFVTVPPESVLTKLALVAMV